MLTETMMLQCLIMAGRPRTPEGDRIRDAILVYLRRLELANAPKPTFAELGAAIGRSLHTARGYARSMQSDKLVSWIENQPRTLTLTETGRTEADKLRAHPSAKTD